MARPISWLPRLHDIQRAVGNTVASHFDSDDVGRIFQVQPRAARKLMGLLPQVEALGRSRLVERAALEKFLEDVRKAADVPAYLEELRVKGPNVSRRRKIRALVRDDGMIVPKAPLREDAIALERGQMLVRWGTLEEHMETMFWHLVRIHDDEPAFVRDFCVERVDPVAAREKDEVRQLLDRTVKEFDEWMAARRAKMATMPDGSSGGTSTCTPVALHVSQCNPQNP